jgi:hypothetical protein
VDLHRLRYHTYFGDCRDLIRRLGYTMKSLIQISFLVAAVWLVYQPASAQETFKPRTRSFSLAVSAGHYGLDPALGFEIGTPTFSKERFCVRFKTNLNWLEQYKSDLDKWVSYNSFGVSWVYNTQLFDRSRIYVDMGTFVIIPNSKFAASKNIQGLSGFAGVELFVVTNPKLNISYYFGGGLNYAPAYADKMENKPRYGNGFVFSNGLRFYF